jgi:hypothetical protein
MRLALRCAGVTITVLAAADANANTELLKTQAGSVVHWTRTEVVVGVDATAASRFVDRMDVVHAIQRAAHAWNRIPASQPRFRFTTESARDVTIRFCRGQWQGDAIDLGKTQFDASPRDGSVSAAVIELNECDHRFTPPGERASSPFDLQSVLTHELGHVLGLGHSDTASAVMFPSGKGVYVRLPNTDDETALAVLYIGRQLQPSGHGAAPPEAELGLPSTTSQPADVLRPARTTAPTAGTSAETPTASMPADAVPVLHLNAGGGRQVTVSTGEPTLLPPLSESPNKSAAATSTPRRGRHR